ncbi:uncharacterized protein LOC110758142 [Prunus avium]|uniref:Uncharacterized protein LOC110758141 n=1 Tax=Prunus avium TaxID=42229 RepID=A0A6P5SPR3_PRUAV|nr:uncharacterized protein LOC110758141 [Prunus avium]XP_021815637.1 uncharacterized protein LOC110758142 [Prunus avium]
METRRNMVQTLEAIKGGGGSIRVGTTGTVSSLMTRELESIKVAPPMPASSRSKHQTASVSVPCGATTPKKLQPKKSCDEASSSGTSNYINQRRPEISQKTKTHAKKTSQIPILSSDNVGLDRTPSRQKTSKKGPNIVEVVDLKCGNSDRAWAGPITNRLKKLGFSKLSESIV